MKHTIKTTACLLIGLGMAFNLQADPPEGRGNQGKSKSHHQQGNRGHDKHYDEHSDRYFSGQPQLPSNVPFDSIRRLAIDYRYTGYRALPPGIQKNLARGKPLPPGIAKQAVPEPLLQQLPVYPGYEWGVYGTDLILINAATGLIQQVLYGIFQ